jgi:rhodanese-related sulfurtransferase
MKKISLYLIGLLFIPALLLTSCDRGDDILEENPIFKPPFETLKEHMIDNNLDINYILSGPNGETNFVAGAPAEADLDAFLNKYTIFDIRRADDFAGGHIKGAINVPFSDILDEAANAPKQILVVCYTGQTACYATSLLRLYGYPTTQALKWGMSGWNPATAGSWNNNTGDAADGNPNWSYDGAPANVVFDDPELSSLSQDGSEILRQRVEDVVAAGFKTASGGDVLSNPSNYFINNYFSAADYDGFGHVKNAYRIKEELKLDGDGYRALNPDDNAKVITYCYTGQTSAVMTAWLRVIGYDAYSMTFGMNGIFHSNPAWSTNQWGVGSSVPKNLPLEK